MSDKTKLRKKLTIEFNKFIRLRDKDLPCISCGTEKATDAGHYWPTSQYPQPSMRFSEINVHGQGARCNRFLEGNRQGYRKGLIQRYGEEILEKLDILRSLPQTTWTVFEYESMIKVYKQKCREIENGMS